MKIFRPLLCACLAFCSPAYGQMVNNGVQISIASNTVVVLTNLGLQNNAGGTLTNQGTLQTSQGISNASGATLSGNGNWQLAGNWTNAGVFNAGTSTVTFTGSSASAVNAGGQAFYNLSLNKSANDLTLTAALTVNNLVNFQANNNKITCGNFDFVLTASASITGADADNYFITGGTGRLKRLNLGGTAFNFPVGADAATYNPLLVAENGTADDIAVRCIPSPLSNGGAGAPLNTDLIDAAWDVTEATVGGSNLTVTAQWAPSDELTGFVRSDCGLAQYVLGTDWSLPPANMGAALGSGPYTRVRSGLTPGILTVADEAYMDRVKLALKIMLQGNFNTATMWMNDNLRSQSLIPLAPPTTYGSAKFVHAGWQPSGGYSVNPSVFTVTGNDAIVDWVFIWLKSPANPATNLQTRVALLQRDGDVVDLDGVSPVLVPASAGSYLVAIGHRNHLSVRTPNGPGIALNEATVTAYDFTTSLSQAFGIDPMKEVQTTPISIFALWGGNANANTSVRATGPAAINDYSYMLSLLPTPTSILSNIYSNGDLNLDGTVRVTGPATINDYSKLLSILGTPSTIITEQQ